MELIIILILSCLCILLAITTALFAAVIPYIYFRSRKLEEQIEQLDTTLSDFFSSIGLNEKPNHNKGQGIGNSMNSVPDENGQSQLKRPRMGGSKWV